MRNNIEYVVEEVTRGMSSFKAKRLSVYLRYRYYKAKGLIDESEKSFQILNRCEQEEALRLAKEGYIVRAIKEGNVKGEFYYDFEITYKLTGKEYIVEVKHLESTNLTRINQLLGKANKQLLKGDLDNSLGFIVLDLNETSITSEQVLEQISRMRSNNFDVKIVKNDKIKWFKISN